MLYIVSTPIGNLDDLSLRQAKVLTTSDIILAEDTRSAKILLDAVYSRFTSLLHTTNYNLQPRLWSYYKEKEFQKLPEIIDLLNEGKKISLISEAGTPLISDPGYLLVKNCIQRNLPITVIPGPSAVTTALIYSGFNPDKYMFLGFFPRKEGQIFQLIDRMKLIKMTFTDMVFVFYESPLRINRTLQLINQSKYECEIVICREMTKKFEEIIHGPISELIKKNYRGELTILIK